MDQDKIEEAITQCQIAVAQHGEQIKAISDNMKRQNGLLDDVKDGVATVVKKLDAVGISLANRINEIERSSIHRDVETESGSVRRDTASDIATNEDIETLKQELLKSRITDQRTLFWKVVGAISAIAVVVFSVILTFFMTHTFGIII